MVNLLLCVILLFGSWTSALQQTTVKIDGIISSAAFLDSLEGVVLHYQSQQVWGSDTSQLVNGKFSFSVPVSSVSEATLIPLYRKTNTDMDPSLLVKNTRKVYIGDGDLSVGVDESFRNAKVTGSRKTADYDIFNSYIDPYTENNERVYQETRDIPKEEQQIKRRDARKAIEDAKKRFLDAQPANNFSIDVMKDMISLYQNKQLFLPESDSLYRDLVYRFNSLSMDLRQTPEGKEIAVRLDELKGRKLPSFSGPSLDGGTLDISSFKGRVFLIDFWGSWCIWCRKGHPHLKELYAKYKPLGFEIVGVGVEFDKDRATGEKKLRKAMAEDGITWPQIYNLNSGDGDLREIFSIYAYPTKILVDRQGNIVLRVTDDEERKLDAKLAELFTNKT